MSEEDQPPEHIWGDDERLISWFAEVRRRHGGPDKGMEAVPQPSDTHNLLVDELHLRP